MNDAGRSVSSKIFGTNFWRIYDYREKAAFSGVFWRIKGLLVELGLLGVDGQAPEL